MIRQHESQSSVSSSIRHQIGRPMAQNFANRNLQLGMRSKIAGSSSWKVVGACVGESRVDWDRNEKQGK